MPIYARSPACSGRLTSSLQPGFDPAAKNSAAPNDPMTSFVNRRQFMIEWGHCDPAGIVFNSRFFEYFDWCAWEMFEAVLGVPRAELFAAYDIMGIPLVDARARFLVPVKFGDAVDIDSEITEFRRSSFNLTHRMSVAGE